MFYETRKNTKEAFRVLSCVIYTIIINYVCIEYLACEYIFLSKLPVNNGAVFKHGNKIYDRTLGIGIPDLLMNLMSFHGFLRKKNSVVVLKCPKRMLEYYFSKGFIDFDSNKIN